MIAAIIAGGIACLLLTSVGLHFLAPGAFHRSILLHAVFGPRAVPWVVGGAVATEFITGVGCSVGLLWSPILSASAAGAGLYFVSCAAYLWVAARRGVVQGERSCACGILETVLSPASWAVPAILAVVSLIPILTRSPMSKSVAIGFGGMGAVLAAASASLFTAIDANRQRLSRAQHDYRLLMVGVEP